MKWQSLRCWVKPVGSLGQSLENVLAHSNFFYPWGCDKGHFVNRAILVKSPSEPRKTGLCFQVIFLSSSHGQGLKKALKTAFNKYMSLLGIFSYLVL